MDSDKQDTEVAHSNPNATGPHGLRGDMGVSSERTGPYGGTEDESADQGVQGTGSVGEAATSTEGTMSTSGDEPVRQHPQEPAEGPEMDDTQQAATQNWRDGQPEAGSDGPGSEDDEGELSLDRSAGESNTAEVPGHDLDPARNPGHSHG